MVVVVGLGRECRCCCRSGAEEEREQVLLSCVQAAVLLVNRASSRYRPTIRRPYERLVAAHSNDNTRERLWRSVSRSARVQHRSAGAEFGRELVRAVAAGAEVAGRRA